MTTIDFLRRVLPSAGWLVLVTFPPGGGKPQHKVTKSVEQLAAAALAADAKGYDAYHACASYAQRRVWDERRQKYRLRTADNAAWVRSQWVDIDVGPKKAAEGKGVRRPWRRYTGRRGGL
jgi:hypothetical protein